MLQWADHLACVIIMLHDPNAISFSVWENISGCFMSCYCLVLPFPWFKENSLFDEEL